MQAPGNGKVEVGGIDTDIQRGILLENIGDKVTTTAQQFRQARQHLADAHHRQAIHIKTGFETGRNHARPADTDKTQRRIACPELLDQAGAENVAGGFAGNNGNGVAGGSRHYSRTIPRSLRCNESSSMAISALSPASSCKRASASANVSPLRYRVR